MLGKIDFWIATNLNKHPNDFHHIRVCGSGRDKKLKLTTTGDRRDFYTTETPLFSLLRFSGQRSQENGKNKNEKWKNAQLGNGKRLKGRVYGFVNEFSSGIIESKTSPVTNRNRSPKWQIPQKSREILNIFEPSASRRRLAWS